MFLHSLTHIRLKIAAYLLDRWKRWYINTNISNVKSIRAPEKTNSSKIRLCFAATYQHTVVGIRGKLWVQTLDGLEVSLSSSVWEHYSCDSLLSLSNWHQRNTEVECSFFTLMVPMNLGWNVTRLCRTWLWKAFVIIGKWHWGRKFFIVNVEEKDGIEGRLRVLSVVKPLEHTQTGYHRSQGVRDWGFGQKHIPCCCLLHLLSSILQSSSSLDFN